jgi:hypothetical protein
MGSSRGASSARAAESAAQAAKAHNGPDKKLENARGRARESVSKQQAAGSPFAARFVIFRLSTQTFEREPNGERTASALTTSD